MTDGKGDDGSKPAAYWQERAEEALTLSESMSDGFAQNMMREIAKMYDRLAKRAAATEEKKKGE
jgi:hypothetical protein